MIILLEFVKRLKILFQYDSHRWIIWFLHFWFLLQGVAAKQAKNSSVKKLFIVAVVPEVPENHFNIKAILNSLNLEVVEFSAAADVKMRELINSLKILVKNMFQTFQNNSSVI